jgi:hypothetical protein
LMTTPYALTERCRQPAPVALGGYYSACGRSGCFRAHCWRLPEHLDSLVLKTAADLRKVVTVFGNDCDRPDGTRIGGGRPCRCHQSSQRYRAHQVLQFENRGWLRCSRDHQSSRGSPKDDSKGNRTAASARIAERSFASRELQWRPRYSDVRVVLEHAWRWLNCLAAREGV